MNTATSSSSASNSPPCSNTSTSLIPSNKLDKGTQMSTRPRMKKPQRHGLGGFGAGAEELGGTYLGGCHVAARPDVEMLRALAKLRSCCRWSSNQPAQRATITVTRNRSRMENVIRLRRLYLIGHRLEGFWAGAEGMGETSFARVWLGVLAIPAPTTLETR